MIDRLTSSPYFDADWYCATYPDVVSSGLSPAAHYLKYGHALNRNPGPAFDVGFYLETYADAEASGANPLIFHEDCQDRARRPTSRKGAIEAFQQLEAETRRAWLGPDVSLIATRDLTFALPRFQVSQSADDRLEAMLAAHATFSEHVEFLVLDFSDGGEATRGYEARFSDALALGLLRVIVGISAPNGGGGERTNALREFAEGKVGVELEVGDVVPVSLTRAILAAQKFFPEGFVYELAGETGRRIAMPTAFLRTVSVDDGRVPGCGAASALALRALAQFPAAPFIAPKGGSNLLSRDETARLFRKFRLQANRVVARDQPELIRTTEREDAPLEPLAEYGVALACILQDKERPAPEFADHLSRLTRKTLSMWPIEALWRGVFGETARPRVSVTGPVVIAVARDVDGDPTPFVNHYLGIGAACIVLIDARSDAEGLEARDGVFCLRPAAGDADWSTQLWMDLARRALVAEGQWVLVPMADEFLCIPPPYADLVDLSRELEARGRDFADGLALEPLSETVGSDDDAILEVMSAPPQAYLENPTIKAGFGRQGEISWRFDARYHLTSEIAPLARQILFRHWRDRYLAPDVPGQTFVDLGQPARVTADRWARELILPILKSRLGVARGDLAARLEGWPGVDKFRLRPVADLLSQGEEWLRS